MTTLEWWAWLVLLIVALAMGLAVTLSNAAVTRAIRRLERTYRRQKSLELEQLQAQAVARRLEEVRGLLAQPDGWRKVLDQVLADAVPNITARLSDADLLEISAAPVPRFTVLGVDGTGYTFTTSAETLQRYFPLVMKGEVIPLDAALHPALRAEVQAVWDHLAAERLPAECPLDDVLPRQAHWDLIIRPPRRKGR